MDHDTTPPRDSASVRRSTERTPDRSRVRLKFKWTATPDALIRDVRLSRDARLLGCLLLVHTNNAEKAFPSQEELAREMGLVGDGDELKPVSVRSVQRWLSELRDAGWLEWRQTIRNNEYVFVESEESLRLSVVLSENKSSLTLNNALTGATALSPPLTPEHDQDAEYILTRATPLSCSDTTQGSHADATQGSRSDTTQGSRSDTTQGSRSTLLHVDPNNRSTTTEHADVVGTSSTRRRGRAAAQPEHTTTSLFLQEYGVSAALELRNVPEPVVRQKWFEITGGQPTPQSKGLVVNALRAYVERERRDMVQNVEGDAREIGGLPTEPPAPLAAQPALDEARPVLTNPAELWAAVLVDLRMQVSRSTLDSAFRASTLASLSGDTATVVARSLSAKEQIEAHSAVVRAALNELTGRAVQVRVVIAAKGSR